MKKHFILWLLALLIAGAWNLQAQTFSGGSGGPTDPYQIKTRADLDTLAKRVNNKMDFANLYLKVMNDIDLGGSASPWIPIGSYTTSSNKAPFQGHFDGGNFILSNLYIRAASAYQGFFGYVTNDSDGSIKNLHIVKGDIVNTNGSNTGGIAGRCNMPITNCSYSGIVTGQSSTGGIVGDNGASKGGVISYCYTSGTFSGSSVGGIVGAANDTLRYCYSTASILASSSGGGLFASGNTIVAHDCYYAGTVSGAPGDVHALVGGRNLNGNGADAVLPASFNTHYDKLLNGMSPREMAGNTGGVVIEESTNIGRMDGHLTTAMLGEGLKSVLGTENWTYETGLYPRLSSQPITPANTLARTPIFLAENNSAQALTENFTVSSANSVSWRTQTQPNTILTFNGNNVAVDRTQLYQDSTLAINGSLDGNSRSLFFTVLAPSFLLDFSSAVTGGKIFVFKNGVAVNPNSQVSIGSELEVKVENEDGFMPISTQIEVNGVKSDIEDGKFIFNAATKIIATFEAISAWDGTKRAVAFGAGSSSDPYLVYSPQELAWIADSCNRGVTFSKKYFRLMNDIDLNNLKWTPIGKTSTLSFKGNFLGNDKTISQLKVDESTDYAGLFGYVSEGNVKDLTVIKAHVKGTNYVGGIAGFNAPNAESLAFNGTVEGTNNVGGIFGETSASTFKNSYFSGNVIGKIHVGGVIGRTTGTYNTALFSVGSVTGDSIVGGIAGSNSMRTIKGGYSAAAVCGGTKVGGILGTTNNSTSGIVAQNFFVGTIECTRDSAVNIGAIVGTPLATTASTKNYYDAQLNPQYKGSDTLDVADKFEGRNTQDLIANLATLTGSSEYDAAENLFPRSAYFDAANHPALNLAASPLILWSNESKADNRRSVKNNFTVSTLNQVVWTSSKPNILAINNGTVSVTRFDKDTTVSLTATLGTASKTFALTIEKDLCVITGSQSVCAGDSATLHLVLTGSAPFTFKLTGDSQNRTSSVKEFDVKVLATADSTAYSLIAASNAGGNLDVSAVKPVSVIVLPRPTATFGDDLTIETGENADVALTFTGKAPYTFKVTTDGLLNRKCNQNDTILSIAITETKTLKVLNLSDAQCAAKTTALTDSIRITVVPVGTLLPPHSLIGTASAQEVELSWTAPGIAKKLEWNNNYAYDALPSGTGNFPSTWAACYFDANDLKEFAGQDIDSIGFYPYHFIMGLNVHFYINDTLVSTQAMDVSRLTYKGERIPNEGAKHYLNKLALPTAFRIPAGKKVTMAFQYMHGNNESQFIACVDNLAAIKGKSDLTSKDNGLTFVSSGKGNNVMTAYIKKSANDLLAAKIPAGYNVFRGTEKINADLVEETSFVAPGQPVGLQSYSVKTVDKKGLESESSFALQIQVNSPDSYRGAPLNITATVDNMTANLSWKAPLSNVSKLSWIAPDAQPTGSIGFNGSAPKATIIHSFSSAEVANLSGQTIDAINVYFTNDSIRSLELLVFQNDVLMYSQKIDSALIPAPGAWKKIALTTPYSIQAAKSLQFGYHITHYANIKPIGLDNTVFVNEGANRTSPNRNGGAWTTLFAMNSDLKSSWMLSADISGTPRNLSVSNYDLYRNDAKIKSTTELSTTDAVPLPGKYRYHVVAQYSDAVASPLSRPADITVDVPSDYPAPGFTASYTNLDTIQLEWGVSVVSSQLKWHTEPAYMWSLGGDGKDVDFSVGAGFDKTDLLPYSNHEITGVDIVLCDDYYSVDVVIVVDKEIVASKRVQSTALLETITTNFDTPFKIPANKDVIVGYHIVHEDGKKPIGIDGGPIVAGKGDLFNLASVDGNKSWYALSQLPGFNFPSNFVIAANVREVGSNATPTALTRSKALANGDLSQIKALNVSENIQNLNAKTKEISDMALASKAPASKAASLVGYNMYRNGKKINNVLLTEKKYSDVGMNPGDYVYNVSSVYANDFESNLSAPFKYTYIKPNTLLAPRNLVNNSDTSVNLSWERPLLDKRIKWSKDSSAQMTIGFTSGSKVNAWILSRFTQEDLAGYKNPAVTHIRFDLTSASISALKVGVFYGDMLIYQQKVSDWQLGTNVVSLDMPIDVDPNNDLMFGYWCEYASGVKPHAMDFGPMVDRKGNMLSTNGGYNFRSLFELNASLKYNWILSAYLESDEEGSSPITKASPIDSAIVYRVYRNGKIAKDNIFGALSFRSALPTENSSYYVTALYGKQGIESAPSNTVSVTAGDPSAIRPSNEDMFVVYPNPTSDFIMLKSTQNVREINIFDIEGRLLRVIQLNKNEATIDVSKLKAGIYYLQMIGTSENRTVKLVKN